MTNSINGERQSAFGSAYKYNLFNKRDKNKDEESSDKTAERENQQSLVRQNVEPPESITANDEETHLDNAKNQSLPQRAKRRGSILNALI